MITIPIRSEPANSSVRFRNAIHGDESIIQGIAISSGTGLGRPCFYHVQSVTSSPADCDSTVAQQSLFKKAHDQVQGQLSSLITTAEKKADHDTVAIFQAHKMILDELQSDILNSIDREDLTACHAVEKCFNEFSDYFSALDDNYLSERADDFKELGQLLLSLLTNSPAYLSCKEYNGCQMGECVLGNAHILVADELNAQVAIRIRQHTRGIVTDKCGANSHAALIARSLDIPVISGIKEPMRIINHQDTILIDGDSGKLVINPDNSTLNDYQKRLNRPHKIHEVVEPLSRFKVLANLDLSSEVKHVVKVKADGVGLYRTEFEILARERSLTEAEQFECYTSIIEQMRGKPVYFRLFDLGSDKAAPGLDLDEEENPALGCRGARLLLARPELLKCQARALAWASQQAQVNVVYPMVATLEQFLELKKLFLEAIDGIKYTNLRHGIMFEIPSACENAEALYEVMDFGKVGSNDLMQYLYAYDRSGEFFDVAALGKDPAIWNLLQRLVAVARKAGKPLEVCGVLADYPEFIPRLIELGIDTISTHCENIAAVRKVASRSLDQD